MTLKNLLIAGMFGALAMSGAKAVPVHLLVSQENMGKVELVKSWRWCKQHPHHHKCHHRHHPGHHHRYHHMYDDRYNKRESYCRHNPFRDGCQRFCMLNPGTCSTKGRYK